MNISEVGFTIVELLIVIVVIAILALISVVSFNGIRQQAVAAVLKSDLRGAQTQLELAHLKDGSYPSNGDNLPHSTNTAFTYSLVGASYCITASSEAPHMSYYLDGATGALKEGECEDTTPEPAPPHIVTTSLLDGQQAVAYSTQVVADGTMPISFSVVLGSLPDGLAMNGSSGVISGNPTSSGTYTFTVRATNADGMEDKIFTIIIAPAIPVILTTTLPDGFISTSPPGSWYSATIDATPSSGVSFSIASGALPPGLSLNSATGAITGNPTVESGCFGNEPPYNFTVSASNSSGSDTQALSIYVLAGICR